MDELGRHVSDAFEKEQAELGDLGRTRERLMRDAMATREPGGGSRTQFAAGVAALVLAALVVATFAYIRAGSQPTHEGPPLPHQSPSPTSLNIIDVDLVDASTGWILLTNCVAPMTGTCSYSVAATADGGRSWSKAVQVGPPFYSTDGGAPRTVHFVNRHDGFVSGGASAFATHDGGRTWGPTGLHPVFYASPAVVGRGSQAWVVSYPCVKGSLCPYEVRSSADAGRTWSSPFPLPMGLAPLGLVAIGSSGLLVSTVPYGEIELTTDGGATWSSIKSQCALNTFRALVTTADGNELWERCLGYQKGGPVQFFVSEDGGKSWSVHKTSQLPSLPLPDYSTVLVSPSAGTALTASDSSPISITHDRGLHWTVVGPSGVGFVSIRFANETDGWALDVNRNVWFTNDGGDHWTQLQLPA
jgi:photosystem II stability/assembly factor-like uncharacterized protein